MNTKTTMLACILAAGTTSAQADIFTWFSGSGLWEDAAMWNGPVGQYPDSILDSATISGTLTDAQLTQNLALGNLTILNGATVYSATNSIFVSGHTEISGIGSNVTVTESSSLRDFDTDSLNITEGIVVMYGGLMQIDDWMQVNGTGGVLGTGIIEMNSTTGDLVVDGGALWAQGNANQSDTLLVTRTDSSTSRLDWTNPTMGIIVWDGLNIVNELPYTGPLGGEISLSSHQGSVRFESDHAFLGANTSEFNFSGNNSNSNRIIAPAIDMYGDINASGSGFVEANLVAMRGDINLTQEALLAFTTENATLTSVQLTGTDGTRFSPSTALNGTLTVNGGLTEAIMGNESVFDLDGAGNRTTNIVDGSTLWIQAQYLDNVISHEVGGTINIAGTLHVEPVNGENSWPSAANINLDGGEITGRHLMNTDTISGTGTITASVFNNGEIIADGGTLQLSYVDMDGGSEGNPGNFRAVDGDLVMNMNFNGNGHNFIGEIRVGNGEGIREVFQSNVDLQLNRTQDDVGTIRLNSGFMVLHDTYFSGDIFVDGVSMLRTTGADEADRISFLDESVVTVNGTLEVDGRTWFGSDATFLGSGTIDGVSTVHGLFLQGDTDLGDISLVAAGDVWLIDSGFAVEASMHALTL